jgi:hypothetical protein
MLLDAESLDHGAPMISEGDASVVRYTKVLYLEVGRPAILIPVDHPSPYVVNGRPCTTSFVQGANSDNGEIETKNTVYKPAPQLDPPYFILE